MTVLVCVSLTKNASVLSVGDDMVVETKSGKIEGFVTTAAAGKEVSAL